MCNDSNIPQPIDVVVGRGSGSAGGGGDSTRRLPYPLKTVKIPCTKRDRADKFKWHQIRKGNYFIKFGVVK